ncbi:MAG: DUF5317 domain-containing protein [Chloroflexi bacterium]|nr:DUF5317 domain-containing protein [Chloroflexota bacterium]
MIILFAVVVSFIVALLRGGQLTRLADLNFRWRGVIIFGFLLQVLIFSGYWQAQLETKSLTPYIYVASMLILVVALAKNLSIPGMPLLMAGLCLNSIAIISNGGYMPASPEALALAGKSFTLPGQVNNNSMVMGPSTQLFFLCDIFAIPKGFIFPNVFSIGDVLIGLGGVYLIQKVLVVAPKQQTAQ